MTITNLIRKGGLALIATATPATLATPEASKPATVASVATVAVAADALARSDAGRHDFADVALFDDLASTEDERLRRRYPADDDRRHCACCQNLARSGLCLAARRGEIEASESYHPVDNMPRRCEGYSPLADDPDQRPGRERWPGLKRCGVEIPKRNFPQFPK